MFRKKAPSAASGNDKNDLDPVFEAKVKRFQETQVALVEVHQAVGTFMQACAVMCASARALSAGLEKLCAHQEDPQALKDVVETFGKVHHAIDTGIRSPVQRVASDTVLKELVSMLNRMPPLLHKIDMRKRLVSDFDGSNERLRLESARDPTGSEATRLAKRVESAAKGVNQITQDITLDLDDIDSARPAVLKPVSALVGCELFFFGRSADLLQGLAARLPLSSTSLCVLATQVPRPETPALFRALSTPSPPGSSALTSALASASASPPWAPALGAGAGAGRGEATATSDTSFGRRAALRAAGDGGGAAGGSADGGEGSSIFEANFAANFPPESFTARFEDQAAVAGAGANGGGGGTVQISSVRGSDGGGDLGGGGSVAMDITAMRAVGQPIEDFLSM